MERKHFYCTFISTCCSCAHTATLILMGGGQALGTHQIPSPYTSGAHWAGMGDVQTIQSEGWSWDFYFYKWTLDCFKSWWDRACRLDCVCRCCASWWISLLISWVNVLFGMKRHTTARQCHLSVTWQMIMFEGLISHSEKKEWRTCLCYIQTDTVIKNLVWNQWNSISLLL